MSAPTPAEAARKAFVSGCVRRGISAAQVIVGPADDAAGVWRETAQAAITAYAAQHGPWTERAAEILTEGQP